MINKGKVLLIILDGVGIGAMPDAHLWGDENANTLIKNRSRRPTWRCWAWETSTI